MARGDSVTDIGQSADEQAQEAQESSPRAVVVAADRARLDLYARTLRLAEVPTRATLDLDEAEAILTELRPSVLVLDYGLPRVYLMRLNGLVRGELDGPRVKVLFVGQDGESDDDDYFLPGQPSPLGVAAQVVEMVAAADDAAATEDGGAGESAATLEDSPDAPSSVIAGPWPPRDRETESDGLMAAGVAAAAPADTSTATPDSARARSRRRIDVMLFRIGMVLLILGGLLAFVRPQTFSLPMNVPPVSAPATPTSAPAASPSPAGVRPIDMDEARTLIVVLVSPAGSGVVDQAL